MAQQDPPRTGIGCLFFVGVELPVTYALRVREDKRGGGKSIAGSVTGDPDRIREAYRATTLRLRLDDGVEHELDIVAHAEHSSTAYFESAARPGFRPRLALRAAGGGEA